MKTNIVACLAGNAVERDMTPEEEADYLAGLPTLAQTRASSLASIEDAADARDRALSGASADKKARWLSKAEDAELHLLANAEATARLQSEASVRGMTVDDLVTLIRTKRFALKALGAGLEGVRSAGKLAIETAADIDAITAARSAALAAIAAVGV